MATARAGQKAPATPGRPASRRSASRSRISPAHRPSWPPASAPPSPPPRGARSRSASRSPSPTPTKPGAGRARHVLRPRRRGQRALHAPLRGSHRHRARVSYSRTVKVKTGACGIARRAPLQRLRPAGRLHRQGERRATPGRRRSRSSTKLPATRERAVSAIADPPATAPAAPTSCHGDCAPPTSPASRASACARGGCAPGSRRWGSRSGSRRSSRCSACPPPARRGCSKRSTSWERTC